MGLHFNISGGDELDRQLMGAYARIATAVKRAIVDTVLDGEVAIINQINAMHAVASGDLKDSIKHGMKGSATELAPGGLSAVIGSNLTYAIPVHEGYIRKLKKVGKVKGRSLRAQRLRARLAVQKKGGTKAGKSVKNVLLKQVFVAARDTETGESFTALAVQGRPYMREAIPEIEDAFKAAMDEHIRKA